MNDSLIEELLRKAPAPKAPGELEATLIAGIRLPRAQACEENGHASSWRKRWTPALFYGAFAATCLGVIGVEAVRQTELRRENDSLRVDPQSLAALREANAEAQRLRFANAELEDLRKDNADIARLRDEIAQLQAGNAGLDQLRAENQRLKASAHITAAPSTDFFAKAEERAERIMCVNNMKQLGLAARLWANDHGGSFPTDFASITNELPGLNTLQDPGDKSRHLTDWAQVAAGDVSYQVEATGLKDGDSPNTVIYECPRHRIIGLLDGSVQMLSESALTNKITIDTNGRKVFNPDAQ